MNTQTSRPPLPESTERYGEGQNHYTLNIAEGEKGTGYADFECYGFDSLKALQGFRKSFPEKMKNEYHYQLSQCVMSKGRYRNIDIVTAKHYKKFIKLVKASGVNF
ncbi:TPA: hypothetical protein ACHJX8_003716 [Yersinia enterocolitica]|uniref:Uncharacterized protein n=1 Tax=Yersinia massiliensis TaxID=419257 RepID=A0ABM6V060_9GAMM|nr:MULTISPECIES: hypothetical protein [Yersinia]AVX40630.1 hypothetical protein DA391_23415 [Yersinia massiliensis]MCB5310559.1 hypothetical protein [Yersinia massiliensis]OWF71114.1 hypothetical protein B4902_20190 [Yersinia frederiksenii]